MESLSDNYDMFNYDNISSFEHKGVYLRMTCPACPEQYDAFMDGKQVGYFRLRHGTFRVDYPDCDGRTIFAGFPDGDGIFEDDERSEWLTKGVEALLNVINGE